jgi:hypothetical protein
MRPTTRRCRGVTHADVVVALFVLLLVSTFAVAQIVEAKETNNRIKCAQNLRMIGQGILLYANENRGAFPRAVAGKLEQGGPDPVPVWGTPYEGKKDLIPPDKADFTATPFVKEDSEKPEDKPLIPFRPAPNDVTAALYMLLRTQDITTAAFVCPSTSLEKFEFGGGSRTALHWTNWPGNEGLRNHLSYSYQNPYPSIQAIGLGFKLNYTVTAEFAVASDMNPGGEALLKLNPKSTPQQLREGNSFNHDRDGQNILYADSSVHWRPTPFAGVKVDNIFTYGKSGKEVPDKGGDGIVGSPVGPDDTILLPTARDIGQVDEKGHLLGGAKWERPTVQQAAALKGKILGEYEQAAPNAPPATLKVTQDQLIAASGPITVTFTYAIDGVNAAGDLQVALAAPQTKGETARIAISKEGDLVITRNRYYQGTWKRKR